MPYDSRFVYVEGENPAATPVRPHNWAERFAGNLASYGADHRLRYASTLEPVMIRGVKCLRICRSLAQNHPSLFHEIIGFAGYYNLPVHGLEPIDCLAKAS